MDGGFDFAEFFQQGGIWMPMLLLLGMATAALGLVALLLRTRAPALVSIFAGLACLGLGFTGYVFGMIEVAEATATVARDQVEMAYAAGSRYAMIPLYFGAFWATPGVLAGLLALVFRKRPR